MAQSGAGPRNPRGDSDEVPGAPGRAESATLERANVGGMDGPAGEAPAELVSAGPMNDGPKGEGPQAQPGTAELAKRAAGVEVELPAELGAGGLTLANPGDLGLPERRARRESALASLQIARFVLDRSGGKRSRDPADPGDQIPTYMLREREIRSQVAEQFGGTEESEQSVELGLAFLARVQKPDGSWTLHNWPGEPRGDQALSARNRRNSETAGTGLALLAFLGAGYDHTDGPYQQVVKRGLDWLVRKQKEDGDLFTGGDDPEIRMYAHGIAAIPLCEAFAMSRDPALQDPVRKALQFTLRAQDLKWGGWRYQPGRQADTSVTGWQMMSLKSGELSGFGVPPTAYEGVTKWLDFAARGPEGNRLSRYAYLPATNAREESDRIPNPAMTAESLLMRLYLGWDRKHPALQSGADYLMQNLPPRSLSEQGRRDCYYWYYGTQVMYQMQGKHWKAWNERLRPLLVDSQVKAGALAGSWEPRGDKWGEQGGRLYVTCMHLLMLEVYYRHLPLFRLDDSPEAAAAR
ncbi:MAG TPA: prenyltransferase/squalene oxidase repeat-containing protein [Pirellulales bacterium]